jgi:hypothetical protein
MKTPDPFVVRRFAFLVLSIARSEPGTSSYASPLSGRMKATILFTGALVISALATGCANNAETGAATGAAGGAVLGGIIGHNTGHSTAHGAEVGAAAGALAGAAIGHRQDNQARAIQSQGDQQYVVQQPPPAPTSAPYENVPARPSNDSVWVAGYYDFVGGSQYQWVPGHWETPPPGARSWVNPMWQPTGNGYTYVRGHWQ